MRLPHLRRHAPLRFLRRCLLRHPCILCRQAYGHRYPARYLAHIFYPGVERGGSKLSSRRACAERACGGNEHLVRHPSRPRGKHTKADAGEDKHVITLPDGEGLPVVRYISNLSGKTSALSQCASRYDSGASLYIRFGGGSVLAVVSSSQLQYIRGADGEHV